MSSSVKDFVGSGSAAGVPSIVNCTPKPGLSLVKVTMRGVPAFGLGAMTGVAIVRVVVTFGTPVGVVPARSLDFAALAEGFDTDVEPAATTPLRCADGVEGAVGSRGGGPLNAFATE